MLKDSTVYPNGVPSNPVTTPLNVNLDYGDLPDTYKTLLASDGARHLIYGVRLGAWPPTRRPMANPMLPPRATILTARTTKAGWCSALIPGQTATFR